MNPDRHIALRVAWHLHGTLYRWGGDDPTGLDCSGLVIECLQAAGAFPRGEDTTAEGLWQLYRHDARFHVDSQPGDLVFWRGSTGRMVHVGLLLDPKDFYMGAEGGGRRTRTRDDAVHQNAYVCVRPVESRGRRGDRYFANPYNAPPVAGGESPPIAAA